MILIFYCDLDNKERPLAVEYSFPLFHKNDIILIYCLVNIFLLLDLSLTTIDLASDRLK